MSEASDPLAWAERAEEDWPIMLFGHVTPAMRQALMMQKKRSP